MRFIGINVPIPLNDALQVRVFGVAILFLSGYIKSWAELKLIIFLAAILFLRSPQLFKQGLKICKCRSGCISAPWMEDGLGRGYFGANGLNGWSENITIPIISSTVTNRDPSCPSRIVEKWPQRKDAGVGVTMVNQVVKRRTVSPPVGYIAHSRFRVHSHLSVERGWSIEHVEQQERW